MRTVRVIPCLDVDAGRVVKGVNFVGLRDAGDPVELAARYDQEGADEVVFLDITASSDARETMVDVVSRTADEVFIPFTVGGGVRSVDDGRRMLRAGADTSLGVDDARHAGWFAVAPPLRHTEDVAAASDPRPTLLAVPERDQFRSPESAREVVASWTNTEVIVVPGADHFLMGRTDRVVELAVEFINRLLS